MLTCKLQLINYALIQTFEERILSLLSLISYEFCNCGRFLLVYRNYALRIVIIHFYWNFNQMLFTNLNEGTGFLFWIFIIKWNSIQKRKDYINAYAHTSAEFNALSQWLVLNLAFIIATKAAHGYALNAKPTLETSYICISTLQHMCLPHFISHFPVVYRIKHLWPYLIILIHPRSYPLMEQYSQTDSIFYKHKIFFGGGANPGTDEVSLLNLKTNAFEYKQHMLMKKV